MNKDSLKKVLNDISSKVNEHGPEIAIGCGVLGMAVAAVDAVRVTPKALRLIEDKKNELEVEELTAKETLATTWKCYILPVVVGVASATCIIGASKTNWKRKSAMAAAYTITETRLSDYQKKAVEIFGEAGDQQIKEAVAKEKVDQNPVRKIVITDKSGEMPCYDTFSDRFFKSDRETIRKIVNDLNERLLKDSFVPLNDLYYEIGLKEIPIGEKLGWRLDKGNVEISYSAVLDAADTPCLVIDYDVVPEHVYL